MMHASSASTTVAAIAATTQTTMRIPEHAEIRRSDAERTRE